MGAQIHPARGMEFDALSDLMSAAVAEGLVSVKHRGGVSLYCYTEGCRLQCMWTQATMMARGLILDHEQRKVIATPFPKFFNVGERGEGWPDLPFDVFEKVDGSLIIAYWHNGNWNCATKGSLNSSQALWAQRKLHEANLDQLWPGATYLFEAVYAENRIVVRYPKDELVLLGAYWSDGIEATYGECKLVADYHGWRLAKRFPYEHVSDLIARATTLPIDQEGFVLRFANGLRLKVKGDKYCRVHRLISGCTPLALWESMLNGDDLARMRRDLPEEFWPDFDQITGIIAMRIATLNATVQSAVDSVADLDNKEIGLTLKERFPGPERDFVFHLRNKGNLLPPVAVDGNIPAIRRSMFMQVRPSRNELPGYVPSASAHRIQEGGDS